MSEIESTIKPDEIPPVTHSLNDKTYESYIEQGFADYIPHAVEARHTRLMKFIAQAGDHEIVKNVWRMHLHRKRDKVYVVAEIELTSTDFWGAEIKISQGDYQEGFWTEQTKVPKRDEQHRIVKYIRGQPIDHYTIEFSKKAVDEIIGEQDRDSIDYHIHHEGGPQKGHFTYEQFVNNKWPDNMELLLVDGEPKFQRFNKPKLST